MSTCPRVGAVTWWLVTLAVIMLLAAAWSVDDTIVPRGPDADEPLLSWFPDPPPPPRFEPPTPPASPQTPPPAPAPARLQTPPQTPLTPELTLHGQNAAHYTTNSSKEVPTVSSTRATTTGSASSSPTSMSTTSASSSPTSIFDRYEVKCAPPQPLLAWLCIKYMCHISIMCHVDVVQSSTTSTIGIAMLNCAHVMSTYTQMCPPWQYYIPAPRIRIPSKSLAHEHVILCAERQRCHRVRPRAAQGEPLHPHHADGGCSHLRRFSPWLQALRRCCQRSDLIVLLGREAEPC